MSSYRVFKPGDGPSKRVMDDHCRRCSAGNRRTVQGR
jgi:hypothetical protein